MKDDLQQTTVQTLIGLATLIALLEEKGIINEDEFNRAYEKMKETLFDSVVEKMKSSP